MGYGAKQVFRNCTIALGFCALAAGSAPAQAEPLTLVALGDSLTQGYGLPQGEGLVPQLQAWLDASGAEVRVVNAGVSGDTTAGGKSRLDWALEPGTDALMVALGGNDLLRGIDPATSRANLDAILAGAQARGLPVLLVGMEAPGNYGPDFKAAFDAMYPELAAGYDALLVPSIFAPLLGGSDDPAAMRPWMQDDGIHPNAEGVKRIVAALGPAVTDLLSRAKNGS